MFKDIIGIDVRAKLEEYALNWNKKLPYSKPPEYEAYVNNDMRYIFQSVAETILANNMQVQKDINDLLKSYNSANEDK